MPNPHQIVVIDPAVHTAELDCFNQLALSSSIPATYHLPGLFGLGSLPTESDSIAGIIILGSRTSVYEGLPWQKPLEDWLRPRLTGGIPTLGLCFGHQLVAHLFGAKVGFLNPEKNKRSGWRTVTLSPTPLTGGAAREGLLLVSHREVVQECPSVMRIVGKSSEVRIEALEHKSLPIWSFQSHPEATPALLANFGLPAEPRAETFSLGRLLVRSFLELVASRSRKG